MMSSCGPYQPTSTTVTSQAYCTCDLCPCCGKPRQPEAATDRYSPNGWISPWLVPYTHTGDVRPNRETATA